MRKTVLNSVHKGLEVIIPILMKKAEQTENQQFRSIRELRSQGTQIFSELERDTQADKKKHKLNKKAFPGPRTRAGKPRL